MVSVGCQDSWMVGWGKGTVAGGTGGAGRVGLFLKLVRVGVGGAVVGSGGGGGGGNSCVVAGEWVCVCCERGGEGEGV